MFKTVLLATVAVACVSTAAMADTVGNGVSDEVIAKQRATLAIETDGKGYSSQSPRDIEARAGENHRIFGVAPAVDKMTLCDIHFHESAEHKGGMFTRYAGNGDGHGYGTGFKYDGELTEDELAPIGIKVGASDHGDLEPGDTIEIHFVYSTAKATIGHGLGTCMTEEIKNPQLRVEAVVGVLVSEGGEDFTKMAEIEDIDGLNQVPNLPADLGAPVQYEGSTTGPGYNEKGSPFQVSWSVRPEVIKLNLTSVDTWLKDNPFGEDHAHGVRNLVTNPGLLSEIK